MLFQLQYFIYKSNKIKKESFENINQDIYSNIIDFLDYNDIINLMSVNKSTFFKNIKNKSPINSNLYLIKPTHFICQTTDTEITRACNIYYNKCYLKKLYKKYFLKQPEPLEYTIQTLNNILLRTIYNNRNEDRTKEQNYLIEFGSNLTTIQSFFFYNRQLTNITIPKSIFFIRNCAFNNNQLTQVSIPDTVITIGVYAFSYNRLTRITIPDSVITIENGAFRNNQLKHVTIGNFVNTIQSYVFWNNALTKIIIPNSVMTIKYGAFRNNRLSQVSIPTRFKPYIDSIFDVNKNIKFIYT